MKETEVEINIPLDADDAATKVRSVRLSAQTDQSLKDYKYKNKFANMDETIQHLLARETDKDERDCSSPKAVEFRDRISKAINLISSECDALSRLYDTAADLARVQADQDISDLKQALSALYADEKKARDALVQAEKDKQALREDNQRLTAHINELQKADDRMRELERRNTALEEALNSCRDQTVQFEQLKIENIQLRSELNVYKALLPKNTFLQETEEDQS